MTQKGMKTFQLKRYSSGSRIRLPTNADPRELVPWFFSPFKTRTTNVPQRTWQSHLKSSRGQETLVSQGTYTLQYTR
jgi:hypothetical protein